MEVKRKQGKPSLTERLLSSLFLDYLECNGFTFTISVFMPESQMASWRPFAYQEMLELLHLDPSSDLHIRRKLVTCFFFVSILKFMVVIFALWFLPYYEMDNELHIMKPWVCYYENQDLKIS